MWGGQSGCRAERFGSTRSDKQMGRAPCSGLGKGRSASCGSTAVAAQLGVRGQGVVPSAGGDSRVQKNVTVSKEWKRGLACLTGEAGPGSPVALGWPSLAL